MRLNVVLLLSGYYRIGETTCHTKAGKIGRESLAAEVCQTKDSPPVDHPRRELLRNDTSRVDRVPQVLAMVINTMWGATSGWVGFILQCQGERPPS